MTCEHCKTLERERDEARADRDEYAERLTRACADEGVLVGESPLEVLTHFENQRDGLRADNARLRAALAEAERGWDRSLECAANCVQARDEANIRASQACAARDEARERAEKFSALYDTMRAERDEARITMEHDGDIVASLQYMARRAGELSDDNARLREALLEALLWARCDLNCHGPGPSGGFQKRVETLTAALAAKEPTP